MTKIAFQELPDDFFQSHVPDNIMEYGAFKANCCMDYHTPRDFRALVENNRQQILSRSAHEVKRSALAGNPQDHLELGLRMWSGCDVEQDKEGAMIWWGKIGDPKHPAPPTYVPRPIQTKALACLASAFLERSDMGSRGVALQIDDIYRAGKLADMAAGLGYVSPSMLGVAAKIEQVGLRTQADCKFEGVSTTRYEELEFLWKALEAHRARKNSKDKQRNEKASETPNLYRCAAEECGIEATSKSGLLRCGGPCSLDIKPSYCCKECQRADWQRHKPVCKGAYTAQHKPMTSTTSLNDTRRNIAEQNPRDEEMVERKDGRELTIEVPAPGRPGEKMKIASTTLTPVSMKVLRDVFEKTN